MYMAALSFFQGHLNQVHSSPLKGNLHSRPVGRATLLIRDKIPPPPPLLLVSYSRKCTRGQTIHLLTDRGFRKLIVPSVRFKSEIETPRLKNVLRNGFKYFMRSSSLAYSPNILVVSTIMNMVSVLSISTELHSSTNVAKPE